MLLIYVGPGVYVCFLFVGRVSGLLIRDCPFGFLYNQNNNNYSSDS
jgi:hypothetical protein